MTASRFQRRRVRDQVEGSRSSYRGCSIISLGIAKEQRDEYWPFVVSLLAFSHSPSFLHLLRLRGNEERESIGVEAGGRGEKEGKRKRERDKRQ